MAEVKTGELKTELTPEWRWENGDGSACLACGEACWLRLRRLYIIKESNHPSVTNMEGEPRKLVVCASCMDRMWGMRE